MKFIVAIIITIALAVAPTSADNVKVDCRSVSYIKYVYAGVTDCTEQAHGMAAFKVGVCENTLSLFSSGKSSKFAYNATSKWFTETVYEKADCAGSAVSAYPVEFKLDTCTVRGENSYKIVAATQAVDYYYDETCSDAPLYIASGECLINTKITCSADNKKFQYQLFMDEGCNNVFINKKDNDAGKCIPLEELAGAGTLSIASSFVIMAFAIMFM